jgi:cytochrome c-type biogenesis protein CcmH/NrfG
LGKALAQAGQLDAALQQFDQALRLDPKNSNAREGMVWAQGLKERQLTNELAPLAPLPLDEPH